MHSPLIGAYEVKVLKGSWMRQGCIDRRLVAKFGGTLLNLGRHQQLGESKR